MTSSRSPYDRWIARLAMLLVAGGVVTAQQAGPGAEDRAAQLKQSLAASQKQLRQYEWIETTVISLKGEEKSRKQQRVYYGADGKLTKVPLETGKPAASSGGDGGGRGRRGGRVMQSVIENKKEDMQEYMERAAALIHEYLPPSPDRIDAARKAGRLTTRPGSAGRVALDFADYLKPGDRFTIDVDGQANRLAGLNVLSYLDDKEDVVTMAVEFGTLTDGTSYNAKSTLDVKAKNVNVVVQNAGHKPLPR